MVDHVTPERRSWLMAKVRGKNTAPEIRVRRAAHSLGFRFRLHRKDLPGTPDMIFPKHRLAVFVHGCFWHRHPGCTKASTPKSRCEFWEEKFATNMARDAKAAHLLERLGWRVAVIWECETKNDLILNRRLREIGLTPPPAISCMPPSYIAITIALPVDDRP